MNRIDWLALGFVFLVVGAVADVVSTIIALSIHPFATEVNPIANAMLDIGDPLIVLSLFKLASVIIVLWGVNWYIHQTGVDNTIMAIVWGGGLWWTILGINNLWQVGII